MGFKEEQESVRFWETPAKGRRGKYHNLRLSKIKFVDDDSKLEVDIRFWRTDAHQIGESPTKTGIRLTREQARDLCEQLGLLLESD